MIGIARPTLLLLFACLTWIGPLAAETPALTDVAPASGLAIEPVTASHGMVVAQEGRAARIGVEVLEQGGIDTAIDYRETAPAATTRTIFLDEHGEADPHKSLDSALAIGVPGTVAGLALAHSKYGSGRFTLGELIAPAIALAREGIPIEADVADSLPRVQARLARWPSTANVFFHSDGRLLGPGDILIQRDLAETLASIARAGPRAFYEGAIAEKIVTAVRAAGGLMTRQDLETYVPIERAPVRGRYRGHEIVAMPPSSSGGVILIEMLNMLE